MIYEAFYKRTQEKRELRLRTREDLKVLPVPEKWEYLEIDEEIILFYLEARNFDEAYRDTKATLYMFWNIQI